MLPAFQTDPHPLNLGIITLPVKEQNLPRGERTRRRETRRGRGRDLRKSRMRSWRRGVGENLKMGEKRWETQPLPIMRGNKLFHSLNRDRDVSSYLEYLPHWRLLPPTSTYLDYFCISLSSISSTSLMQVRRESGPQLAPSLSTRVHPMMADDSQFLEI
jgi:hypothetical protein